MLLIEVGTQATKNSRLSKVFKSSKYKKQELIFITSAQQKFHPRTAVKQNGLCCETKRIVLIDHQHSFVTFMWCFLRPLAEGFNVRLFPELPSVTFLDKERCSHTKDNNLLLINTVVCFKDLCVVSLSLYLKLCSHNFSLKVSKFCYCNWFLQLRFMPWQWYIECISYKSKQHKCYNC